MQWLSVVYVASAVAATVVGVCTAAGVAAGLLGAGLPVGANSSHIWQVAINGGE